MSRKNTLQNGFTLLEVLIALTITGMALGSIFNLLISSKQLALKSADSLEDTIILRAALNEAQLLDGEHEFASVLQDKKVKVSAGENIPPPERQTKPVKFTLQAYTIEYQKHAVSSVRWQLQDLAK